MTETMEERMENEIETGKRIIDMIYEIKNGSRVIYNEHEDQTDDLFGFAVDKDGRIMAWMKNTPYFSLNSVELYNDTIAISPISVGGPVFTRKGDIFYQIEDYNKYTVSDRGKIVYVVDVDGNKYDPSTKTVKSIL